MVDKNASLIGQVSPLSGMLLQICQKSCPSESLTLIIFVNMILRSAPSASDKKFQDHNKEPLPNMVISRLSAWPTIFAFPCLQKHET